MRRQKGCLFAANYLKGAVHEGLVQVDDDTVPAVVCYTDLWQQELGWWLRGHKEERRENNKTLVIKSWELLKKEVVQNTPAEGAMMAQ